MTDFFRINMPYGMQKNDKGEWMFFNREYTYLGNCSRDTVDTNSPFYCSYRGITDELLESLAEKDSIERNETGEITRIWFYKDATTPARNKWDKALWDTYVEKLRKLCSLIRL